MKRLSLPQLIWLSGLIAMVGTHFLIPLRMIIPKGTAFIGYVLLVAGVYYMLQAHKTIRNKAMLTYMKAPDVLLTTGPFRYSRNPLYLGWMIIGLGLAIILGSFVAFIVLFVQFLLLNFKVIPTEEKMMENTFGTTYTAYRKQVRRWI